ncbi:unnamed protein product [Enterobius vermicularis]|uniref:Uncharacterized protein n=1 Tax=Enterobius vermicularis TaxID=51028 RepID=A0A3P6IB20_ENTVE|nr:unnamed protein product [Enterobius vermicularis]
MVFVGGGGCSGGVVDVAIAIAIVVAAVVGVGGGVGGGGGGGGGGGDDIGGMPDAGAIATTDIGTDVGTAEIRLTIPAVAESDESVNSYVPPEDEV